MIYIEDNFLSEKEFSDIKQLIPKRYPKHSDKFRVLEPHIPIRYEWHDLKGNYKEGCRFLGISSLPAIEKTVEVFNKLNIPAVNFSVWFAYMFTGMRNIAHVDGALRNSKRSSTYTTMYYTSDWQKGWGGELIFGESVYDNNHNLVEIVPKQIIEPIPNRQVIWSREQAHEVYVVTHPDPNFVRCSIGSGWSSFDDQV
jgi:Rps23 Pro-64 3,4-dihydroxylase Tpa1-like proline 4-hydroxylase